MKIYQSIEKEKIYPGDAIFVVEGTNYIVKTGRKDKEVKKLIKDFEAIEFGLRKGQEYYLTNNDN